MTKPGRHRAASYQPKHGTYPPGRRRDLIAVTGGGALLVVIGVLSAWAQHSLSTARPVSPTTAASSAAPLGSPLLGPQLHAWLTQAGPSIDVVVVARYEIATAAANEDITGTGARCESADDAVAALQHNLPSPDPVLTNAFQQAINSYRTGLRHCIVGVNAHDGNDIGQAAAYIRQASAELQTAIGILTTDLPDAEIRDPGVVTV